MTSDRTFATWVEPIAAQHHESRAKVIHEARQMFPEQWHMPSPLRGWSYQDLLAHMASSDASGLHLVLRAVIAREPVDASLLTEVDARNARNVKERRGRTVKELIAELEAAGEETQELLSQLSEDDEELRQDDIPMSLGEGLAREPGGHDREHLAQFRKALDSVML